MKFIKVFIGLIVVVCLYLMFIFVMVVVLVNDFIVVVYGEVWCDGVEVL